MSERKSSTVKKNSNRLKGRDKALYQSQQHNYYKKVVKVEVPELTIPLFQ